MVAFFFGFMSARCAARCRNAACLAGPQLSVLLAGYVVAVEHRVSWSFKAMATPIYTPW
jgi:hypothetical protein